MEFPFKSFIGYERKLLQINENKFDEIAWLLFHFQSRHNPIYSNYLERLKIKKETLRSLDQIPCLPIQFFKNHSIKTGDWPTQRLYKSSGTTQTTRSGHHLWDESFYLQHAATTFEHFYGPLDQFHVLALLPTYDTGQSSLVAMAKHFIKRSQSEHSGFFLSDHEKLIQIIEKLSGETSGGEGQTSIPNPKKRILLLGVSHALLDLADLGPFNFPNLVVMETGGMKGRKEELTRAELHTRLKVDLGVSSICSEYGMTELCSQAYSLAEGTFQCAPTMRVIIKEVSDPFSLARSAGIINVIDLANFHSCAFIETQDLGRVTANGFEVLGRTDNSEARGCNLLVAQ
jgi:hypothetical protein